MELSTMTNNKEILLEYRDHLEPEMKDIFLWAIGQNAVTESNKTVRDRERESRARYRYTNYIHYSDYISRQGETFNTVEPTFST